MLLGFTCYAGEYTGRISFRALPKYVDMFNGRHFEQRSHSRDGRQEHRALVIWLGHEILHCIVLGKTLSSFRIALHTITAVGVI